MVVTLVNPILAGVLLSGVISAMMSTASSEVTVSSASFTEDIFTNLRKKATSPKGMLYLNQAVTVAVGAVAIVLALTMRDTVYSLVSYAWSGIGSSFGPALMLLLFWKKLSRAGVFASLVTGTVATVLWKNFLEQPTGVSERLASYVISLAWPSSSHWRSRRRKGLRATRFRAGVGAWLTATGSPPLQSAADEPRILAKADDDHDSEHAARRAGGGPDDRVTTRSLGTGEDAGPAGDGGLFDFRRGRRGREREDEMTRDERDGRIPVAILGATGAVGQRMVSLLAGHPQLRLAEVAASERSQGKTYLEATRWFLPGDVPEEARGLVVKSVEEALESRLVLSALDAKVADTVEPLQASRGRLVVSNTKSFRMQADVPLLIPEVNADHLALLDRQEWAAAGAASSRTRTASSSASRWPSRRSTARSASRRSA